MQITKEQLGKLIRVDSATSLVQDLETNHGVIDPQIMLILDSNDKVHILYNSKTECEEANLDVPTVINTKVWPRGDEVIKTIYPGGNIGICTNKIIGKPAKWFPGP